MRKKLVALSLICSILMTPFTQNGKCLAETNVTGSANTYKLNKRINPKKIEQRTSKNSTVEWNIQAIKADMPQLYSEQDESIIEAPIKVAILDSGVDYTPDVEVYERKNFIPQEDEVSVIYEDSCGHGTNVAGIIAAKNNDDGITGINPNVQLYSAKILDKNLQAPISRVIEAINWAIEKDVNIINISFGTTTNSPELKQAIQRAYEKGILIVAAAGNKGVVEYPAAYDEVIAVGSVNSLGEVSQSSARGEEIELVAPGEQILSTGDFGGVSVSSGTSMAAPHVVGVASLLWQKDKTVSNEFIRQLLDISANSYGDSYSYGNGLIDLEYALTLYDDFKEAYNENMTLEEILNNLASTYGLEDEEREVPVFNDVDYVEGCWLKNDHASMAGTSTTGDIAIIKQGAKANDEILLHMQIYPLWHGFWTKTDDNNSKIALYYTNYISAYIFLTECARQFPNNKMTNYNYVAPTKPNYMTYYAYNSMKSYINSNGINGYLWHDKNLLDKETINNRNKRLLIYGMALHVATDTFAHSTYKRNSNGEYSFINHDDTHEKGIKDADNSNLVPERYICAQLIAKNVVSNAFNGSLGNLTDYITPLINYYNNHINNINELPFRMANLGQYAKEINTDIYKQYQGVFDKINITKSVKYKDEK